VSTEKTEEAGPARFNEFALRRGQRHKELRREYAALGVRELEKLANETAMLAAELRALVWERLWSAPTSN